MEAPHQLGGQGLLGVHWSDVAPLHGEQALAWLRTQELVVAKHELVADRHELSVHLLGRLRDADVVAEALRHLLHPIQTLGDGNHHRHLPLLARIALQLPTDQEVEGLVRPSELDVRLHHDRVVALQEGIEELVESDRGSLPVALLEVIPLEHARDGHLRPEPNRVVEAQVAEPFAIAADLGVPAVEDAKDLILVGACVRLHLGTGARPLVSSTSITAPWTRTAPLATSKRTGICVRKRSSTRSVRTPSTESSGPHIPASVR